MCSTMTRLVAVSAVLFAFACATAPAEDTSGEGRRIQSIVRNTASPFCPGKTLDSCPSPKAGEWRRDIHQWVSDGVSEPDIRDRLQARVPGFELGIPPVKSGWVIPLVAVASSTWWLIAMARRFRSGAQRRPHRVDLVASEALDARLENELAQLD
jgi:cytochrome c-type biogenesis protein CcmH/NrfF